MASSMAYSKAAQSPRPVRVGYAASKPASPSRDHSRPKTSVLKSFMHRRNNSDGTALPPSLSTPTAAPASSHHGQPATPVDPLDLPVFARYAAGALGELQQNQQDQASRSPRKPTRDDGQPRNSEDRGRSPVKGAFATLSLKSMASRDGGRMAKSRETSPEKPKKTKSAANLGGLLSRPKSFKNLHKLATQDEARSGKDKENRTPPSSVTSPTGTSPPPPIYAQFASQTSLVSNDRSDLQPYPQKAPQEEAAVEEKTNKPRPKSFHAYYTSKSKSATEENEKAASPRKPRYPGDSDRGSTTKERATSKTHRKPTVPPVSTAGFGHRTTRSPTKESAEPLIDPKDIDKHLEAMLDRRNIPENQRYKMRNLNDTIKMEFIRQDWAEMHTPKQPERPSSKDSDTSVDAGNSAAAADSDPKPKRSRGRSFTLRGSSKDKDKERESRSPTKKSRTDATIGRHFRSKSSDSIASDRPSSAGSSSGGSLGISILSKIKLGQGPGDFVSYLRKVQKPELVEVGKLHKLRLLLRNETVTWTEEFIRLGGMEEIVGLLNRILVVEWREEHEDALLHENLLCLKALSTTALAIQYVHSIRDDLFPKIIFMLFDPEKKGPSEFTTRDIVISILFTYIQSAAGAERVARAQCVLSYLRDPEPKEEERPVPFVLEMRRERPYRVWCKEVVSVTKEVFWIFLHSLNVVAMPSDKPATAGASPADATANTTTSHTRASATAAANDPFAYMGRHFPQERPLVPAAPYVGGVEWDATNYLASHVELMNAILACTPRAAARNELRAQLRISGWERCLGGSLRLCKEKFYPGVHDGLRTWVAAAAEDGWDVRDVRYGPPPEARSPAKKKGAAGPGAGNGDNKKGAAGADAPRIEMPKLDLGLDRDASKAARDAWL